MIYFSQSLADQPWPVSVCLGSHVGPASPSDPVSTHFCGSDVHLSQTGHGSCCRWPHYHRTDHPKPCEGQVSRGKCIPLPFICEQWFALSNNGWHLLGLIHSQFLVASIQIGENGFFVLSQLAQESRLWTSTVFNMFVFLHKEIMNCLVFVRKTWKNLRGNI